MFSEVDSTSREGWLDDFQRDRNPEREIRIYEEMAAAYTAYCAGRNLTLEAKKDVYQIVLLRSGAPEAEVLPRLQLGALTPDEARVVLKLYGAEPEPIRVSPSPQAP